MLVIKVHMACDDPAMKKLKKREPRGWVTHLLVNHFDTQSIHFLTADSQENASGSCGTEFKFYKKVQSHFEPTNWGEKSID